MRPPFNGLAPHPMVQIQIFYLCHPLRNIFLHLFHHINTGLGFQPMCFPVYKGIGFIAQLPDIFHSFFLVAQPIGVNILPVFVDVDKQIFGISRKSLSCVKGPSVVFRKGLQILRLQSS